MRMTTCEMAKFILYIYLSLCWFIKSEVAVGGMVVEVEPSHHEPIIYFLPHLCSLLLRCYLSSKLSGNFQNDVQLEKVYEAKVCQ